MSEGLYVETLDPVAVARYEKVELLARQDARADKWDRDLGELEDLHDHYDEIVQEELTEIYEESWSPDHVN